MEKEVLYVCPVCPSVKKDGEWREIGQEFVNKLKEVYDFSHVMCSLECVSKGYKLGIVETAAMLEGSNIRRKYS